jgi:dTDP-4-dehydrorhamnose reductase
MIRILVTGANGQVGSEIQFLAAHTPQCHFTFTDRTELDITSAEAVQSYFEQHSFDYLINCAAYTAGGQSRVGERVGF